MFARTISLIGNDNLELIKSKTVLVVGLGGVGGYVVETLIRSGIENIILVDYDTISLSNLNRQIISTRENIGNKKTLEFKKRINSINPKCNVTILDMFLERSNINVLDNYKIVSGTYEDGEVFLDEVFSEVNLKATLPLFVKE